MPARTFTRKTIRWRMCAHCGTSFPDSRKDRRYCKRSCKQTAHRLRQREGAIQAQGGKCGDCGKVHDPDYGDPFFLLRDGSVVCGWDLARRAREAKKSRRGTRLD